MKKVFKIILILLAAFALTLLIIWFIGRSKAQKSGQTPLSFKQFLGLGTKANPAQTVPGENTSAFTGTGTGTNNNGNAGVGGIGGNPNAALDNNIQVSNFTNGSITPGGISLGNGLGGSIVGGNPGSDIGSSGNPSSSDTGGNPSVSSGSPTPVCSDEDTTIQFTPDEIAELNELQNRFYTIAQTLHTDADVQTEIANHDAFAVKADQATELYNYCEVKLPMVAATGIPQLNEHLSTPFWMSWGTSVPSSIATLWGTSSTVDPAQDSLTFLYFGDSPSMENHLTSIHDTGLKTPGDDSERDSAIPSGPYGVLNWSAPQGVMIDGSIVKAKATVGNPFDPTHTITGGTSDYGLLIPVVEKILRINLW